MYENIRDGLKYTESNITFVDVRYGCISAIGKHSVPIYSHIMYVNAVHKQNNNGVSLKALFCANYLLPPRIQIKV